MASPFYLSLFTCASFLLAIYAYDRIGFSFLQRGKDMHMSLRTAITIAAVVIAAVLGYTWFVLAQGNPSVLQDFYIIFFALGFLLSWILLLPKSKAYILLSIAITALSLAAILRYDSQLLQNIFMAFSLIWVGAFVFKKADLKLRYFIVFMLLFMIIDIYNIYVIQSTMVSSGPAFVLSGSVLFGGSLLGIGDFFLAYLAINSVQKSISKAAAITVAFVIAFTSFVIYLVFPNYTHDIPYSIVIVPATLLAYGYGFYKGHRKTRRLHS